MTDTHHGHDHHGPTFKLYMVIAVVLAVCTSLSFLFNQTVPWKVVAFILILGVAIIKAVLVGTYFMHLKWDWRMLYFLIVPAFILGAMMMFVLMPDILLNTSHDAQEEYEIAREMGNP